MPAIHGSLNNADFIKANEIAKAQNVELKDWFSGIVLAEIHKLSQKIAEE